MTYYIFLFYTETPIDTIRYFIEDKITDTDKLVHGYLFEARYFCFYMTVASLSIMTGAKDIHNLYIALYYFKLYKCLCFSDNANVAWHCLLTL